MNFGTRVNLHTHTRRCKHACGTVAEYCAEAGRQGIAVLGFSEHSPFPDERHGGSRMFYRELPEYRAEVEAARNASLVPEVLAGLEVDVEPDYGFDFVEDEFLGRQRFDYLIAGVHHIPGRDPELLWTPGTVLTTEDVRRYIEAVIHLIESGLFEYVVHPDLWALCCPVWTPELTAISQDLFRAALAFGIPLEINAYGLRKPSIETPAGRRPPYPWAPFWELAGEAGVQVVVGADAHRPADVWGNTDDAVAFARRFGLEPENEKLAERIIARRGSKRS